jgi:hypothetical protein
MRMVVGAKAFAAVLGLILCAAATSSAAQGTSGGAGLAQAGRTQSGCVAPRSFSAEEQMSAGIVECTGAATAKSRTKRKPARPPALGRPATTTPAPAQRARFTAEEQRAAVVPGIPDARFWSDSEEEFRAALGAFDGPWLALSAGGGDAAFAAGLLAGLSESGRRRDYAVVTGVSSGALVAPFAFLAPRRDAELRSIFTTINAADVFEDRRTPESLLDTWPLREFIAKRITPELLADVAAEHRRGRRLIVITTNLDAGRPLAWNLGAIAAKGGEGALKLFRDVLLASSSIPGVFPPVLIETQTGERRIEEMHVDGGLASTIYAAPDSLLLKPAARPLPTGRLTVIVNGKLQSEFEFVDRSVLTILGRSLSLGVKRGTRAAVDLIAAAAQRGGTEFNLAYVEEGFDVASQGLFDPQYMTALFEAGVRQGRSAEPFRHAAPPLAPSPAQPQAAQ